MIEYALQCKTQTNIRTKKGLHSDLKKRRGKLMNPVKRSRSRSTEEGK